jgi:hypothetical protein
MVFGNGGPWSTATPASVARQNLTSVITGPGSDLAGLNKAEHSLFRCTVTGSGLIINHLYLVSADFQSLIDVSGIISHDHSSTAEGGAYIDILRQNSKVIDLALTRTTDLKKASWNETATLSGTAEDFIDATFFDRSIRLRTNATLGGGYMITYPHLKMDFSKRSFFQCKVRIENSVVTEALRSGVNADSISVADTNTQKYNVEVCTVTNNNWQLRCANGTSKSMSDTGTAATTSRTGLLIKHFPDFTTPEIDLYIGAGTVFAKTSDVPITGSSSDATLISHSIKNSAATDKQYHIFASRLVYSVLDSWV